MRVYPLPIITVRNDSRYHSELFAVMQVDRSRIKKRLKFGRVVGRGIAVFELRDSDRGIPEANSNH